MSAGLTPTIVLRYLNRMLGTLVQELEISQNEMMNVVFNESLPEFSKFFPYIYRLEITADDATTKFGSRYVIPNPDHLEIFGINWVYRGSLALYGTDIPPCAINPMEGQLLNDYLSMTETPTTFKFFPPNVVEILPHIVGYDNSTVEVKAVHPQHLKTIPLSMRDEFLKLCLYDVELSIYPLRHRFESLSTVYGSITPFYEMVDSAEANRNELIQKWHENYLKDATARKIFFTNN